MITHGYRLSRNGADCNPLYTHFICLFYSSKYNLPTHCHASMPCENIIIMSCKKVYQKNPARLTPSGKVCKFKPGTD